MKVYLVQNRALMPTSSYFDTVSVCATLDAAKAIIESLKNDIVRAIDSGDHECFHSGSYELAFDDDVLEEFSVADMQMCFYDEDGYHDIYWIEEHEVITM